MPKERKQRGRRKKKDDAEKELAQPIISHPVLTERVQEEDLDEQSANFFGLLEENEINYFKTIDDAIIADEFGDSEEIKLFVQNVYQEAVGKELKLATSPLGSKVLEALLMRSSQEQVRVLFQAFQGNFHTLIKQRYGSHVCETLFAIAATIVSSEMAKGVVDQEDVDVPFVSTENLFLYMINVCMPSCACLRC